MSAPAGALPAALLSAAALLVTAAGLVSAALALLVTRSLPVALPVLLDMLLAASLLRLAVQQSPLQLAVTALVVLVRLAPVGLRRAAAVRSG